MSETTQLLIAFGGIYIGSFILLLLYWYDANRERKKELARLERLLEQSQAERKDLLDRIQAPTFAEYTNKVIKEKKLEQPPEEEEQNDPFIS